MAELPRGNVGRRGAAALIAAAVSLLCSPVAAEPVAAAGGAAMPRPGTPLQLRAAVHVHSTASTGDLPLDALAELALREGLDALFLTENLVLEFRYAPWPLRYFLEVRRGLPALLDFGLASHLRQVQAVQPRYPGLLLLPGVEVAPYYYWTGSLLSGDLTLHDTQRNLLVVPPQATGADSGPAVEAAGVRATEAFLRGLPVIENRSARGYGWGSLVAIAPGLALLLGGVLGLAYRRLRRTSMAAFLGGLLLLIYGYPFAEPVARPYDPTAGFEPHQRVIDYVAQRGGLAFWSLPEAFDRRVQRVGPLPIRLSTDPHPQALETTRGYVGFGGVYADTVTLLDPGGTWDQLLLAYTRGERATPPWLIGESAFHSTGHANKRLGEILTVLLAAERTRAAAFEALRDGHSYAVRRGDGDNVYLGELTLRRPGSPAVAGAGDDLAVAAGTPVELTIEVLAEGGQPVPCRVQVIRQGKVHVTWEGDTPLRRTLADTLRSDEDAIYYRVEARGPWPRLVVSNPLFVRRP